MPLDVRGFTYDPNEHRGLYKISDDLRRNKMQEHELAGQNDAQRNVNAKYFGNLLDKKDYLTGTNYDPATNELLDKAFQQAMQLSSQGATVDQILMATQPLMSKVNDYMGKAKMYSAQKKQVIDHFKEAGGYDVQKIQDLLDKYTFFDKDGNLDVDNADPSLKSAIQKIDENDLADVATSEGINKWADKYPKEEREEKLTTTDKFGNKKVSNINVKASSWETPENDESGNIRFVPKYEVATDNKQPVIHEFSNADGTTTKAPVRLLDKNVFQNLISSNQSAADYIKGNLMKVLKSGEFKDDNGNQISLNSPKADMVARALAYDFLKGRTGGVVSQAKQQLLSPQQIKINLGIPLTEQSGGKSSGSGDGEIDVNDIYTEIDDWASSVTEGHGAALNQLTANAQGVVLKFARDLTGNSQLGQGDIYVKKEGGKLVVKGIKDEAQDKNNLKQSDVYTIGTLDYKGTNLKQQPSVREKREVIKNSETIKPLAKPEDLRKKYNY